MASIDIMNYIYPEMIILIPVLIILGLMLKSIPFIKDWTIPIILGIISIVLASLIITSKNGLTLVAIANGIIQGILCSGMAVYIHQLTIQIKVKRLSDEQKL